MSEPINLNYLNKKRIQSTICFIGSFVVAFLITWLLKEPGFSDSQVYTLFLLFFAIGLWLTEAIPAFAVSLFIMAYLVFAMGNPYFNSSPEKIDKYVNTFSSSTIWLFLGGFFISAGMTKTHLDEKLLLLTLRMSGTRPRNILLALMFTTMLGSMVISNTAITAMMVAALSPLLHSLGKSGISKAILLGTSISATMGGISTIIGSPPNAIAVGILENTGTRIEFLEWMLYGVPICIVLTVLCYFVLSKVFIKESSSLSFSFLNKEFREESKELVIERNIVLLVLIITVLFWLSSSWHGITIAAVSAIPIVFLTLTGVLKGEDMRALPWDTLFIVAGGLSLGVALESTGILNHYVVKLKSFDLSPFVFILLFSYLSSIFSIFMTNAASCAILIPLGLSFLPGFEKVLTLSIGLSASMALILPISPAWNAIIYSTGLLEQRDFKYGGLIVGILGPLFVILWVFLISK